MSKFGKHRAIYAVALVSLLAFANNAVSEIIEGFPSMCANASTRFALPGHIMRLGFVSQTPDGWSFLFPDQNARTNLQVVSIAENAGLIGQNPNVDTSQFLQERTPNGTFMVAHIFVGDPDFEPIVTCVSEPLSLNTYVPKYYGNDWSWLDRGTFGRWLSSKKYSKWHWKKWWKRDVDNIRKKWKRNPRPDGKGKTGRDGGWRKDKTNDGDDARKLHRTFQGKRGRVEDGDKVRIKPITTNPPKPQKPVKADDGSKTRVPNKWQKNKRPVKPLVPETADGATPEEVTPRGAWKKTSKS